MNSDAKNAGHGSLIELVPQGMQSVELLAPAGGMAALHAAVAGGADAVYLGLESFNARRGADNFTPKRFAEACRYAHLRGVHIYVTLNTIIMPDETERVIEVARQAYRSGADAFIVQDIGLAAELIRALPGVRLHISTQMNTHSAAGIQAAAELGASRVTLARETSLDEIQYLAQVAAEMNLEIESFAHGALCVCYSGQCLMSSLIGGRSANRGTCAQACRLPYELHREGDRKPLPSPGEHLLSPKDLCSVDLLGDLVAAGVSSLKIEGRMKSPDYVYAVVSTYRAVLDRVLKARAAGEDYRAVRATEDEQQVLAEAFSRGFTTAYLTSQRDNDIMSYQRPNNRGVFIGRIGRATPTAAYVDVDRPVVPGDIVEIWTSKGRSVHPLPEVETARDGRVRIPLDRSKRDDKAVHEGDRVFRVRSAEAAFEDDEREPRVLIDGVIKLRIGQPAVMDVRVVGDAARSERVDNDDERMHVVGHAEAGIVEAARTKAITEQDVYDHVNRLGQTSFALRDLEIQLDEGVGMGFSTIHKLRAAALEDLEQQIEALGAERLENKAPKKKDERANEAGQAESCVVVALATNPACARAAKRAGAELIYVPALNYRRGEAAMAGVTVRDADQAGYPNKCIPVLPTIDHDPVEGTREMVVPDDPWEYVKPGYLVVADSLGDAIRAAEEGADVELGPHLPITNKLALQRAADMGATRVWLSPELTCQQIAAMNEAVPSMPLGLTVLGTQELMVTEHCMLMSQGPCEQNCSECVRRTRPHYLKDRKGFDFPVVTDVMGRSHLYNSVQLDVAHAVPELIKAGVSALMVDTTLMNVEQSAQAVGRVVQARDLALSSGSSVDKVSGATTGHLFRGVE